MLERQSCSICHDEARWQIYMNDGTSVTAVCSEHVPDVLVAHEDNGEVPPYAEPYRVYSLWQSTMPEFNEVVDYFTCAGLSKAAIFMTDSRPLSIEVAEWPLVSSIEAHGKDSITLLGIREFDVDCLLVYGVIAKYDYQKGETVKNYVGRLFVDKDSVRVVNESSPLSNLVSTTRDDLSSAGIDLRHIRPLLNQLTPEDFDGYSL